MATFWPPSSPAPTKSRQLSKDYASAEHLGEGGGVRIRHYEQGPIAGMA